MFGLFKKKEMDVAAAEAFWNWFAENEEWIIDNINSNGQKVVWAIDKYITPIFPYCKRELEFQLGYNKGQGEFFFFHFGDRALVRDGKILKDMMPSQLAERWIFILDK